VCDILHIAHFCELFIDEFLRTSLLYSQFTQFQLVWNTNQRQLNVADGYSHQQDEQPHNFHFKSQEIGLLANSLYETVEIIINHVRMLVSTVNALTRRIKFKLANQFNLYITNRMEKTIIPERKYKLYDIAANLTSEEFDGNK
jgi:hypothetical protein